MLIYSDLKKKYMLKEISEEEFERERDKIIERIVEMYVRDLIDKETAKKKIDSIK